MTLFLMILTVSVLCFALACVAFAPSQDEQAALVALPVARPAITVPLTHPRFFAEAAAVPLAASAAHAQVPIEVLLMQIERHVRLEQAAAESYVDAPTTASLHSRTTSPLVH